MYNVFFVKMKNGEDVLTMIDSKSIDGKSIKIKNPISIHFDVYNSMSVKPWLHLTDEESVNISTDNILFLTNASKEATDSYKYFMNKLEEMTNEYKFNTTMIQNNSIH
jgi:hypothetical protein